MTEINTQRTQRKTTVGGIVTVNTEYLNDVLNRAKVSRKQASGELGRSEWYLSNLCQKPPEARRIPLATAKLFCRIYNAELEELVPEMRKEKETPIERADAENIEIIAEVLCKIRDTQRRMEAKIDAIAARAGVTP